ncbi:L-threonylcarbamoyladenylate synthase [Ornithinibacillus sp. 4-3]|uniref:Threonylcarbamoyl-AMP synthase n=1 Tax=Ornithinibacillus sp. 4-3 TaxID=3231488 RepID=A0AB39HMR0_9BACI
METKYWHLTNHQEADEDKIIEAVQLLKQGEVVAFPTETVYGLGADATNAIAVEKIFKAKGRPQDNPLIAHVATKEQLSQLVTEIPKYVERLIEAFSPGPITYVLPSNGICAKNVTAGLSTVAVRIPEHPVANRLLQISGLPIAAPSANTSGKPSPTTALHVKEDLTGKIAGIIDGGATGVGMESTVVDCTQDYPVILRPGGITKEQLEQVVDKVLIDPAIRNGTSKELPKSPGMKYKHYSPEVPLLLVEGDVQAIQDQINEDKMQTKKVGVLASSRTAEQLQADEIIALGNNMAEIATNLYAALRKFKQDEVDIIICEVFPDEGIGAAVMNRLRKAADSMITKNE